MQLECAVSDSEADFIFVVVEFDNVVSPEERILKGQDICGIGADERDSAASACKRIIAIHMVRVGLRGHLESCSFDSNVNLRHAGMVVAACLICRIAGVVPVGHIASEISQRSNDRFLKVEEIAVRQDDFYRA